MIESKKRARVMVCINESCCKRGAEKIFAKLSQGLVEVADVEMTPDCFRLCKSGPNTSVNGKVLQGLRESDAITRVRREIEHPSQKVDGAGTRSLDELDDVLDGLFL
jgi:NADH:ubiquinone oxidoreductase subunit E